MSTDPGQITPGSNWLDPGSVTTGGGTGDPEADFRLAIMDALRAHGVDITILGMDQVDRLMQTLLNTPHLQHLYDLEQGTLPDFADITVTPTQLRSAIEKDLFSPTESQSSVALSTGLGILETQKIPLNSSQIDALATGIGGSRPFQGDYPITLDYGEQFGAETEQGIDYGMPEGTAIYAPFAGVIQTEDSGKSNWGKRVFVYLDNGYKFAVGHMSGFDVQDGQRVSVGDMLGVSGGDPADPSSGQSTGAHIEVQWISPDGRYLNPHDIIDPILAGIPSNIDKVLTARYPRAISAFQDIYGRKPNSRELSDLIAATHGNPDAIREYLRGLPSQIQGLTNGVYSDLRSVADRESNSLFGHGVTDGMLKELSDEGKTSQTAVKFWLSQMDIKGKMDPKTYQSLYQLNQPHMQGVYNSQGFDPRIATQQYQQAQESGIPIPPSSGEAAFRRMHEGTD